MWPTVFEFPRAEWILWVLLTVGGYLLGSVHFCRWIPLLVKKVDVTKDSRDGNPGAANVFMTCGWKTGLFCLFCDMAKGFLPVFAATKWLPWHRWPIVMVMLAPVLGHAFSVFWHFRGGKCIATIFGEMSALLWHTPVGLILAGLYIFFSVAVKIDPHRRRSIVTFVLFLPAAVILELCLHQTAVGIGCACVSAVAIAKHAVMKDDGA